VEVAKAKSQGAVEANLCSILSGKMTGWKDLDEKIELFKNAYDFRVCRKPNEDPVLLSVKDNTATIVGKGDVARALSDFVEMCMIKKMPSAFVKFSEFEKVVKRWSYGDAMLDLPKCIGFKSDPELVMNRLSFDPKFEFDYKEFCPTFFKLIENIDKKQIKIDVEVADDKQKTKISNSDALCMRIGSIYDLRADRKQAIWCYGEKDSGKSQIAWLVAELAGRANAAQLDGNWDKDGYGKAALIGKRVAVVGEAPSKFLRSDDFKSLTGDSIHMIREKYKGGYSAKINCLFFFSSNEEPKVPHDTALIERIITCHMSPPDAKDRIPEFEMRALLSAELPYIAGYCIERYNSIPVGTRIPCDKTDLLAVIDNYEGEYLDFLDHLFVFQEGAMMDAMDFQHEITHPGGSFDPWQFKKSTEVAKLKRIMQKRHKVVIKRVIKKLHLVSAVDCISSKPEKEPKITVYFGVRSRKDDEKKYKISVDKPGTVLPFGDKP
jgi:hypothetical protein